MAQVLSESVALATKCCVPDAPARPKALEERVKSIEGRAEWQLKLTWAKPNGNGHPIQQYCLQQSERLSQGPASGALTKPLALLEAVLLDRMAVPVRFGPG